MAEPANTHELRYQESLERRIDALRARLRPADPAVLAAFTGAEHHPLGAGRAELALPVLGQSVVVLTPEFAVLDGRSQAPASPTIKALVLYHLSTADGTPLTGRWISFRELPDGGFYHQAFQGYTGQALVRHFGADLAGLKRAAAALGGVEEAVGDAAFAFRPLPRVALLVAYWRGDDEFPPSARILFDAAAGHQLPSDACALLGSILTRRLIAQAEAD